MTRELTWAENDTAKRLCGLRHGQHMALHARACDICAADIVHLVDAPPSDAGRGEDVADRIASELCEARYWLHPDGEHHDVQTCDSCKAWVREQLAALRRAVPSRPPEAGEPVLEVTDFDVLVIRKTLENSKADLERYATEEDDDMRRAMVEFYTESVARWTRILAVLEAVQARQSTEGR